MPVASFNSPTFACPDPTNSLYTETINGTCYALVGVHITSKVMPTWLWATFEPNSKITNPNRCDAKLYGACFDPWGTTSSEPYGKGKTVQQSAELRQAMAAVQLNPAFNNYFLTGVQTEFVDSYGKPTQLGNSFRRVQPGSCTRQIVVHYLPPVRVFRWQADCAMGRPENNFGRVPHRLAKHWVRLQQESRRTIVRQRHHFHVQDFSWMLGKMPYSDAGAKAPADKSQSTSKN